jgi:hypothetical protein
MSFEFWRNRHVSFHHYIFVDVFIWGYFFRWWATDRKLWRKQNGSLSSIVNKYLQFFSSMPISIQSAKVIRVSLYRNKMMTGKYKPYWESLVTFLLWPLKGIFFLKKENRNKVRNWSKRFISYFFFSLLLFPDDSRLAARHSTPSISF